MAEPACGHGGSAAGRVCVHLFENRDQDYLQRFTGRGLTFDLVCAECGRDPDGNENNLRGVCPDCFRGVREEGQWDGIVGRPEVAERESGLAFRHRAVPPVAESRARILDIRPVPSVDRNLWIAATASGEILRLDLDEGSATGLCWLPEAPVDFASDVTLRVPDDGRMAALVNTRGRQGVVLDLTNGRTTMSLGRGDYHEEHCNFPIAFFELDGRLLLVHGTDWNRLDISDPATGALLTERSPTSHQHGQPRPQHYLDYFHCGLTVSPDHRYVADNGWVWHPFGGVVTWDLRRWVRENVWESEDGPSKRSLCGRAYYWDGPLCWVGPGRLAVYGYGGDDEWLIPAVRLFDVTTGREERWFPGPKGELVFDGYLFASDPEEGTTVWDVDTGERLLHEPSFCPLRYHRGSKTFLTRLPDGRFQTSRLSGRAVDPSWPGWNAGTALKIARAIDEGRSFDRLPVLADALEEAGCGDPEILSHCRKPGEHGRSCWVVDLLLGKSY
jgi:hypothetical protein